MNFSEFLSANKVYLDGGMGTLLQERGLLPGEYPERWNITHPDVITEIHKSYFDRGSNVISTNTFGANSLKFSDGELEEIISAAFANAKLARELSTSMAEKFIALDIGPTGKLLKPYGDLDFEDAVEVFAKTVRLGVKYGADLVIIETMNDSYETKAALLAVKENSSLPVIVTNAYGEDGKLMTGASPETMATLLCGMGADAIGANCSLGPKELRPVIEKLLLYSNVPVVLKPNAGLPRVVDGKTVFDVTPEEFADEIASLMELGVRVSGGCCGTTPEYIKALTERTANIYPKKLTKRSVTAVCSYAKTVSFGHEPILIGERINPTGKKRLKEALLSGDMDYVLSEAANQAELGAHILDVNVGLPNIDEKSVLTRAVEEIQTVVNLPLQIDTANYLAMESALRRYNGKALINSVCGKAESMEKIFPLAKKYGGVIIALTLDEGGIPDTAEGRVNIAKRIIETAKKYGIDKSELIFDPLAMTVSTSDDAALVTLEALSRIKNELGAHTSLGVSNVSYGLPKRDAVNAAFFTMALTKGLSAAIINPDSQEIMKAYYAYRALAGIDARCADYIKASAEFIQSAPSGVANPEQKSESGAQSELVRAITKGLRDKAKTLTEALLQTTPPLLIIEKEIIPALNAVGEGYEKNTVYLPELLMSAEAAGAAFDVIRCAMPQDKQGGQLAKIVIATVKGDIHDIGKNIVKLILENYGYAVTDLGKDVPPEKILEAAKAVNADYVGLSALMTTTLPAMEETIRLIKERAPSVKIMVGGAVLTKEYADKIGADKYAKDAMEAVRYLDGELKG